MSKYILGIDVGTQSIRAHLYDEQAHCVYSASTQQSFQAPRPSWITQNASFWWEKVRENLIKVMNESGVNPKDIVSIGSCGHMHGPVPVTLDGEIVMDEVQLYSDTRAGDIATRLRAADNAAQMNQIAANRPAPSWFGIKIKWLKENMPEVYERTQMFLTPKDFINFKLTGEACTDPSEASGAYLMDWKTDEWSDALIKQLGLDKEKLPTIKKSYETIGGVSKAVAEETGLAEGTPVVCGGGDMLCELFVSGLSEKGCLVDLNATASVISYYSEKPINDDRLMNLRHVIDGWVPFGHINSSGGSFRWLRDTIAKEEAKTAKAKNIGAYDYLSSLAKETPVGADGLLFMPYLAGQRTMGSVHSTGSFVGMSLSTEMGHFVRALLEGVALEGRRAMDLLYDSGVTIDRVYHISGGAKGELWNQIKADVYGLPVYTLKQDEGGVLGAAVLGGVAACLYSSLDEAAEQTLEIKKEYLPNKENHKLYNELYQMYREVHDVLQQPYDEMAHFRSQTAKE